MKHTFMSLAMAAVMLTVSILPQPAAAYRSVWLRDQQQAVQVTSISPADADALELLNLLGIDLQATDPVWQDPSFVGMVMKYKEIKAESVELITEGTDIVIDVFDFAELLADVDHEAFRSQFSMTEMERAELQLMREEIEANIREFEANPNEFFNEILGMWTSNDFDYDDSHFGLSAYGYPQPYEPVEEGRLVWLIDASYSPSAEWTTVWTQVDGPEVTWVDTDSAHDRAFIVPNVDAYELDYLTFELYVTDADGNESTSYVYVDLARTSSDPIEALWQEVVGSEISDDDWYYWSDKYEQGLSLETMRKHFELFAGTDV